MSGGGWVGVSGRRGVAGGGFRPPHRQAPGYGVTAGVSVSSARQNDRTENNLSLSVRHHNATAIRGHVAKRRKSLSFSGTSRADHTRPADLLFSARKPGRARRCRRRHDNNSNNNRSLILFTAQALFDLCAAPGKRRFDACAFAHARRGGPGALATSRSARPGDIVVTCALIAAARVRTV